MQRLYWIFILFLVLLFSACSSDDVNDHMTDGKTGTINLSFSGRVGTVIGDKLTDYVKSLDLLLFREDNNGIFVLTDNVALTKADLEALKEEGTLTEPGFTTTKLLSFENLLIGTYEIIGVGNMRDSLGNPQSNASLTGVTIGNTMEQVIASINNGSSSPRLFYGTTGQLVLGTSTPAAPSLNLYRKVAMFALTLQNVPQAVVRIDLEVENTYGAFDMLGTFLDNKVITVNQSRNYNFTESLNTVPVTLVSLPSYPIGGKGSAFILKFYLDNGQEILIPIQNSYILKSNTITKLTATVDAEQSGGVWDVELTISISADVEWNVDQEPPIII